MHVLYKSSIQNTTCAECLVNKVGDLYRTCTQIFNTFWWGPLWSCQLFIDKDRLPRKAVELASFGWFQHIGHHFHSILVTEFNLTLRISKIPITIQTFCGNLSIWKLEILWYLLVLPNCNIWGIIIIPFWSLNSVFHSE